MKVQEAKTKWCPMSRVREFRFDGDPAYGAKTCYASGENRGVADKLTRCLGPDCMMWRETVTGAGDCGLMIPTVLCCETRAI